MFQIKPILGTDKCFYDESIDTKTPLSSMTVLRGEQCSFQFACTADTAPGWSNAYPVWWSLDCALPYTLSSVELVPNREPIFHRKADESYLRTTPGMYPDLLRKLTPDKPYHVPYGGLSSLFCVLDIPADATPGVYPVTLTLTCGETTATATVQVEVLAAVLPKQTLTVTQWFHCDCLASLYEVEVFSEEHWQIIENYVRLAVKTGTNAITTPVFTPPMDTEIGYERPTVQLVDMWYDATTHAWQFGFEKLCRWVEMCDRCGAEYFEISHLFWPRCDLVVPKIMATVTEADGSTVYRQVFPTQTDPRCDDYRDFLRAFLTAFLNKMRELGADHRCIFHISDEPYLERLEIYRTLVSHVADLLEGYRRIDAISDVEYFTEGLTPVPVSETMSIEPFLSENVPELWAYYCCDTVANTSNRFLSMSGDRVRIIGAQLWRWHIQGFLHWGFNFWYSCGSREVVNPYFITEGNYFGPAGDAFLVYPGKHGQPEESLRLHYFTEALQDVRALQLAEKLCGREAVEKLVDIHGTLTFKTLPDVPDYCHTLRQAVNALIASAENTQG